MRSFQNLDLLESVFLWRGAFLKHAEKTENKVEGHKEDFYTRSKTK